MREKTDLEGVKFVAKQLVMIDIHLTEYSPKSTETHQGRRSLVF